MKKSFKLSLMAIGFCAITMTGFTSCADKTAEAPAAEPAAEPAAAPAPQPAAAVTSDSTAQTVDSNATVLPAPKGDGH